MTALARLADDVAAHGPAMAFGVPGSGPGLDLIDALEHRGVAFHTTRTEAAAAVIAGTMGRLSGHAGIALSIKGPGLANMVPGLAACRFEGLPLVAVCEAFPPDAPAALAHKRMDHGALAAATIKGRRYLAARGPGFAALARWAQDEAPGPVLLEIAAHPVDAASPVPAPVAEASATGLLLDLVAASRRPIVIAGTLALRRAWSGMLNALRLPVFTTAAAKGALDETLDHAAGVYSGAGRGLAPECALLPRCDLVVGLGLRDGELLSSPMPGVPAVNIDPLGAGLCAGLDPAATAGTAVFDAAMALLGERSWGIGETRAAQAAMRKAMLARGFLPARCFAQLEERFGHVLRMVVDTGSFCTVAEHAVRAAGVGDYLGSGQGRYMGLGIPMALGAALDNRTRPVVLAVGDGGIGMAIAELRLAVDLGLPLLVVLMSDGGYGSIRARALRDGLTQRPLLAPGHVWTPVMAGLGLRATVAGDAPAFDRALADWRPAEGPAFIEVPFAPDAYQAMVHELRR